jgi:hypothetical protein
MEREADRPDAANPALMGIATISSLLLSGFIGPAPTQIFAGEAERSTETISFSAEIISWARMSRRLNRDHVSRNSGVRLPESDSVTVSSSKGS